MTAIKRKWDKLSTEEKDRAINQLIYFFEEERDEKIGRIAAVELINHFLVSVGSKLYNQGVYDAKAVLQKRAEDASYELDELLEL